jgi:hypothetical protein
MKTGRGGMGMRKHGVSGRSGSSPRAKFMRALEDNREKQNIKKPRAKFQYGSVSDAVQDFKPR